jgi:hypothetical protein
MTPAAMQDGTRVLSATKASRSAGLPLADLRAGRSSLLKGPLTAEMDCIAHLLCIPHAISSAVPVQALAYC